MLDVHFQLSSFWPDGAPYIQYTIGDFYVHDVETHSQISDCLIYCKVCYLGFYLEYNSPILSHFISPSFPVWLYKVEYLMIRHNKIHYKPNVDSIISIFPSSITTSHSIPAYGSHDFPFDPFYHNITRPKKQHCDISMIFPYMSLFYLRHILSQCMEVSITGVPPHSWMV